MNRRVQDVGEGREGRRAGEATYGRSRKRVREGKGLGANLFEFLFFARE